MTAAEAFDFVEAWMRSKAGRAWAKGAALVSSAPKHRHVGSRQYSRDQLSRPSEGPHIRDAREASPFARQAG
jgi:hypothetical protein